MKKILLLLLALPLAWAPSFGLATAFADSFSIDTPASPQTWASNPDPVMHVSIAAGTYAYVCWNSIGVVPAGFNGYAMTAGNDGQNWSNPSAYNTTLGVFAGGVGDVHCLEVDYTAGDYSSACAGTSSGAYTACLASTAHSGAPDQSDVVYTLTSSGGGGGTGTTTPPTVIDDPAEQIFDAMILFLLTMFGMIWFMRKH